jgi:hypothetical protein
MRESSVSGPSQAIRTAPLEVELSQVTHEVNIGPCLLVEVEGDEPFLNQLLKRLVRLYTFSNVEETGRVVTGYYEVFQVSVESARKI